MSASVAELSEEAGPHGSIRPAHRRQRRGLAPSERGGVEDGAFVGLDDPPLHMHAVSNHLAPHCLELRGRRALPRRRQCVVSHRGRQGWVRPPRR